MHNLITAIITGIVAFIATNIDDIFILLLFFSQVDGVFRNRHIVQGQYLGFIGLLLVSLPGFFGGMILPQVWLGMLGLAPIILGVRQWLILDEETSEPENSINLEEDSAFSSLTKYISPQTCGVAVVTFANGGDNIGIYVSLFASCTLESLAVILSVFLTLVSIWCYIAYRLSYIPIVAETLARYGSFLVPFILIALGISILSENQTLEVPILRLIILIVCMMSYAIFSRDTEQATPSNQE